VERVGRCGRRGSRDDLARRAVIAEIHHYDADSVEASLSRRRAAAEFMYLADGALRDARLIVLRDDARAVAGSNLLRSVEVNCVAT